MRRTFWQGVTSRAECAKLSASSSFERSSFSFKDFANTSTVFVRVYLIYVYNTQCTYVYMHIYIYIFIYTHIHASAYMYVHAFVYFPTQWRRKLNPMASYRIMCFGGIQFQSYNVTRLEGSRTKSDLTLHPIDEKVIADRDISLRSLSRALPAYPLIARTLTCEFQVALSGKRTEDLSRFSVRSQS